MCSLLLLLTIPLQLAAHYGRILSSSCSLMKTMPRKFQGYRERMFDSSEKKKFFSEDSKMAA